MAPVTEAVDGHGLRRPDPGTISIGLNQEGPGLGFVRVDDGDGPHDVEMVRQPATCSNASLIHGLENCRPIISAASFCCRSG